MVIDEESILHAVWGQSINGWFLNGTTNYAKAQLKK